MSILCRLRGPRGASRAPGLLSSSAGEFGVGGAARCPMATGSLSAISDSDSESESESEPTVRVSVPGGRSPGCPRRVQAPRGWPSKRRGRTAPASPLKSPGRPGGPGGPCWRPHTSGLAGPEPAPFRGQRHWRRSEPPSTVTARALARPAPGPGAPGPAVTRPGPPRPGPMCTGNRRGPRPPKWAREPELAADRAHCQWQAASGLLGLAALP